MDNERTFTFHLTAYDIGKYLPEVSRALERRSELIAQTKYASKKRRASTPKSSGNFQKRSALITLLVGIATLALAALCLIVYFRNTAEIFFLICGLVFAAAGVFAVVHSQRKNPYARDAAKLLKGKDQFLPEDDIKIIFSEYGMRSQRSFIPYKEFQCWMETDDLFMLVYGPLVTLLQKTDLIDGEIKDFRALLIENIKLHAKA